MPKQLTAQKITGVQSIQFATDADGNVVAINTIAEVNYGDCSRHEHANIFPQLNTAQKEAGQAFYDKLLQVLNNIYID